MPFTPSRRPSSRQTQGGAGRRSATALVLLALLPLSAQAEPLPVGSGPDPTDLRTYLECSEASNVQLLGFNEAAFCSTVFMRIKLSFVPDIDLDTFNSLSPTEKTALDRHSYRLYLDWKEQHADEIDALLTEIRSSQRDS